VSTFNAKLSMMTIRLRDWLVDVLQYRPDGGNAYRMRKKLLELEEW
jgi:hypothetical protein